MRHPLIGILKIYQFTLSPNHSWLSVLYPYGYCRFYPSCSTYSINALQIYGSIRGAPLILARLLKCHPWQRGAIDHVPSH